MKANCITVQRCAGSSPLPPMPPAPPGPECNCWPPFDETLSYTTSQVVEVDGVIYVANADIPPGTPFVIGTDGLTWRAWRPGDTVLPPHNDEASYVQYQITEVGTAIYRANGPVSPGPFNAAEWTLISGAGISAIVVEDTPSVTLTGDGAAGTPLSADVNISAVDGNLLTEEPDGLAAVFNYANNITIRMQGDGTEALPFMANVEISPMPGNSVEFDALGLYARDTNGRIVREDFLFSLTNGWDDGETLYIHGPTEDRPISIFAGLQFSTVFAPGVDAEIEVSKITTGSATVIGNIVIAAGVATFSGSGALINPGEAFILKGVGPADFTAMAVSLAADSNVILL